MKTSAELFKLFPKLTQDALTGYRRSGHVTGLKSGRNHIFLERSFLELGFALPKIFEGWAPKTAFRYAREQFESNASQIRSFVGDFADEHAGRGPTQSQALKVLQGAFGDCAIYLKALIEENSLGVSGGQLTLLGGYQPIGMPAYSPQPRSAFQVLSPEVRAWLKELASAKYQEQTKDLEDDKRVPAPLGFIQAEGIDVVRRLLKLGVAGLSDLDGKVITVSIAISPGSVQERWVLAHEYFHLLLKHQVGSDERENEIVEAQATYAAVHYLIPSDTFDRMLNSVEYSASSVKEQNQTLAKYYGVTEGIIERYRNEMSPPSH